MSDCDRKAHKAAVWLYILEGRGNKLYGGRLVEALNSIQQNNQEVSNQVCYITIILKTNKYYHSTWFVYFINI